MTGWSLVEDMPAPKGYEWHVQLSGPGKRWQICEWKWTVREAKVCKKLKVYFYMGSHLWLGHCPEHIDTHLEQTRNQTISKGFACLCSIPVALKTKKVRGQDTGSPLVLEIKYTSSGGGKILKINQDIYLATWGTETFLETKVVFIWPNFDLCFCY